MNGKQEFMVCIRCITYNHESYIEDAMRGFIMQETSFPYVAVIVDDASTDSTALRIDHFLHQYFDFSDSSVSYSSEKDFGRFVFARHRNNKKCYFAVYILKENHYSVKKSKSPYFGEWTRSSNYVALCEGDDYWTDPLKLQKQVAVFERFNDVSLCCSSCAIDEKGQFHQEKRYQEECVVPTEDIIRGGGLWLHTVTYMFRKSVWNNYPSYCTNCHVGDYPLILWASLNGKVYYLPDETAVYRFQSLGSWTQRLNSQNIDKLIRGWRSEIDMLEGLDAWSNYSYSAAFHQRIAFYLYDQMILHKSSIHRILPSFRKEMNLFSRKQKAHVFFTRIHLESVYHFLLHNWHRLKKRWPFTMALR